MNIDSVARYFVSAWGHRLLEPHGAVQADVVRSDGWAELIEDAFIYEIDWQPFPDVLLPQPEPVTITQGLSYQAAIKLFPLSRIMTIIGYSFGAFNGSYDDWETFNFLRDLLRYHPQELLVIDPEPGEVMENVQSAGNLNHPLSLPVNWNCLAEAMMELLPRGEKMSRHDLYSHILYRHDELRDSPEDRGSHDARGTDTRTLSFIPRELDLIN